MNRRVSVEFFRMNAAYRNTLIFSAGILFSSLLPVACTVPSSPGPVAITKVNPYHLNNAARVSTSDSMVRFEKSRLLYGAVDSDDLREKFGNYYTVFWKTDQPGVPATIQLQYRQARTGPKVLTKEIVVSSPKRKNTTPFEVVGSDYETNGPVTQWKAAIVQNGTIVTEYRSFLWK